MYLIYDWVQGFEVHVHSMQLQWSNFSIGKLFAEQCARQNRFPMPWEYAQCWLSTQVWRETTMGEVLEQQAAAILHLGVLYNNEVDTTISTDDHFEVKYNLAEMHQFLIFNYY